MSTISRLMNASRPTSLRWSTSAQSFGVRTKNFGCFTVSRRQRVAMRQRESEWPAQRWTARWETNLRAALRPSGRSRARRLELRDRGADCGRHGARRSLRRDTCAFRRRHATVWLRLPRSRRQEDFAGTAVESYSRQDSTCDSPLLCSDKSPFRVPCALLSKAHHAVRNVLADDGVVLHDALKHGRHHTLAVGRDVWLHRAFHHSADYPDERDAQNFG